MDWVWYNHNITHSNSHKLASQIYHTRENNKSNSGCLAAHLTEELLEGVPHQLEVACDVDDGCQATHAALQHQHAVLEDELHHVLFQLSQEVLTRVIHEGHGLLQDAGHVVQHHEVTIVL
jgi:hypothetical protein